MPSPNVDRRGIRPNGQPFIVGVVQHPTTQRWQPYVAECNANGTTVEIMLISSHRDRPFAHLTAQICFKALECGTPLYITTMVQQSQESELPVALPLETLNTLTTSLRPQLQRQ